MRQITNSKTHVFWYTTIFFLFFLAVLSACKTPHPIQEMGGEVTEKTVCFGHREQDRLFPGISACSYMNVLRENVNVFVCFPTQMFSHNCTWRPVEDWIKICEQPMTYDNFHNGVIFCYERGGTL